MKSEPDPRRVKAEALGRSAEDQAGQYLSDNGWTIINKRTKTRSGEIDIIASRDNVTAFIEVKARMHRDEAISAVTKKQAKRIIAAANYWLAQHPEAMMNDCRFDVILICPNSVREHIENAFGAEAW